MAIKRADALTGTTKNRDFFSDFVTSFAKTPYGDQLGRVTNEQSVNQSIRNIVKTNIGERLFQPTIGSDVYASLFEHNIPENMIMIEDYIKLALENHEPRANVLEVLVNQGDVINKSSSSDENSVEISIIYNLINNPEPITLTVILKRVR